MSIARPIALAVTLLVVSCGDSDTKQQDAQETILMQAANAIGMPTIVNFQEKRLLKEVLELRDKPIPTHTYIVDLNGHLHHVCDSIGYGLPYSTQFTNPSKVTTGGHVIPQADPNGLFSPPSAEGTWVKCIDPTTKKDVVIYIEPRVVVTPFTLPSES